MSTCHARAPIFVSVSDATSLAMQPIDPINFLKFGEDAFRRSDEAVVDGVARIPIAEIEILSPVIYFKCLADARRALMPCLLKSRPAPPLLILPGTLLMSSVLQKRAPNLVCRRHCW